MLEVAPFAAQPSVARAVFDPDRRADEAESLANLIFQEALIGEVQLHGAIGEQDEGRRSRIGLSEVVDFHALADGNRGAFEVNVLEEAVHLAGRDTLAALTRDQLNRGKNFVNPLASLR